MELLELMAGHRRHRLHVYVNASAAEAQAENLTSSYKLIIGSRNYSSWSLRGWLAMQQSGAEFEKVVIPSIPATAHNSSRGLVLVLEDGDLVINDTLAIAEYLAERHPEAGLWPAEARLAPLRARPRRGCIQASARFAVPCR